MRRTLFVLSVYPVDRYRNPGYAGRGRNPGLEATELWFGCATATSKARLSDSSSHATPNETEPRVGCGTRRGHGPTTGYTSLPTSFVSHGFRAVDGRRSVLENGSLRVWAEGLSRHSVTWGEVLL